MGRGDPHAMRAPAVTQGPEPSTLLCFRPHSLACFSPPRAWYKLPARSCPSVLGAGLLLVAAPMTAATGTPSGAVPEVGATEQPVVEIDMDAPAVPVQRHYDTAGPRAASAAPGSGTG